MQQLEQSNIEECLEITKNNIDTLLALLPALICFILQLTDLMVQSGVKT